MLDTELLSEVQRVLLETVDGGVTWASELWDADEVLGYLIQRQNQFLKESRILASTGILPVLAAAETVVLPSDWIATNHVAWRRTSTNRWYPVVPSDTLSADYGAVDWATMVSPFPILWSDAEDPIPALRLLPPPTEAGEVHLVYVAAASVIDGSGLLLDTPDDFCVFLRYGVLANVFGKQGRGFDPARRDACEQRFQEGIDLGRGLLHGWGP